MEKDITNINDLNILELSSLSSVIEKICDKYTNILSDYVAMNHLTHDMVDVKKKRIHDKRSIYMNMLERINELIEEKVLKLSFDAEHDKK